MVNKKSTALKKLNVNVDQLSEKEAAKLLMEEPRIMHRPLFSDGKKLVVGFKEDQAAALLG